MHGCVIENTRKIKIQLENIWIDLMRSIYAPYMERGWSRMDFVGDPLVIQYLTPTKALHGISPKNTALLSTH